MNDAPLTYRFARADADVRAAHVLLMRRIGACLVEDAGSFYESACRETPDWLPRLALAVTEDGAVVGAQLGGLLPAVALVSLPYTAVAEHYEGRGVYRRMKTAMLAELRALAAARGLPPPAGDIAEEAPGSAQYARKVGSGIATVLPIPYRQPAVQ